ncbi:MAG: ABC transporter permease [Chitinispirillia bacterium]|nr:ABC transporter permease [Chitinispirillia bacterium]
MINSTNRPTGKFSLSMFMLVIIFLYVPLVILVAYSFNAGRTMAWEGFSLNWYHELFFSPRSERLWMSFKNSAIVAVTSAVFSTIIGTLGAIGLYWYKFRCKKAIQVATYIPMLVPEIIIGVSLMMLFVRISLPLSLVTVFIAHITFNIPFVLLVVMARLESFDYTIIEAAHDLGASEIKALTKVILPVAFPGIISAFLIAITLSLEDFVITFFVAGPGASTLPLYIHAAMTRSNPDVPTMLINALSLIVIAGTVILALLSRNVVKYMFQSK